MRAAEACAKVLRMRRRVRRPTFSGVVACAAIVLTGVAGAHAIGGWAHAGRGPDGSGGEQGPKGAPGARGPNGLAGAEGTGPVDVITALIGEDGTVLSQYPSDAVTGVSAPTRPYPGGRVPSGTYHVTFNRDVSDCSVTGNAVLPPDLDQTIRAAKHPTLRGNAMGLIS